MATQNTILAPAAESGLQLPPLPSERQPGDFAEHDRVLALYYRTWMDEAELIEGMVTHVHAADRPDWNGSPGFVNLKTTQTPDLRTGRFVGIDLNSAALIPEDALPYMKDEDFRANWVLDGSVAWLGEREMLEEKLRERVAQGNLRLTSREVTAQVHDDSYGHHHPSRAREHIRTVPGSSRFGGKVGTIRPLDMAGESH